MSAWAKPGVKCVCVRGGTPTCDGALSLGGRYPIAGLVYTVAEVRLLNSGPVLVLVEIPDAGLGTGWGVYGFRPLVTKTQEQDVALFRHILDGLPVGESA